LHKAKRLLEGGVQGGAEAKEVIVKFFKNLLLYSIRCGKIYFGTIILLGEVF